MVEAVPHAAEFQTEHEYDPDIGVDTVDGFIENPDEVAQAVINAAWTKFDDDPSTWPENNYNGMGKQFLFFGDLHEVGLCVDVCAFNSYAFKLIRGNITHYVDPMVFITTEQI